MSELPFEILIQNEMGGLFNATTAYLDAKEMLEETDEVNDRLLMETTMGYSRALYLSSDLLHPLLRRISYMMTRMSGFHSL